MRRLPGKLVTAAAVLCLTSASVLLGCAQQPHELSRDDYDRAVSLSKEGRTNEAMAAYREAIAADPRSADAYNNLGALLFNAGQTPAAIAEYQRALALRPDFAEARNNLGVALLSSSRTAEAVGEFRRAVAVKPRFVAARFNLCLGLEILGQLEEALAQCQDAAQINPTEPGVSVAVDRLQTKLKEAQGAAESD